MLRSAGKARFTHFNCVFVGPPSAYELVVAQLNLARELYGLGRYADASPRAVGERIWPPREQVSLLETCRRVPLETLASQLGDQFRTGSHAD